LAYPASTVRIRNTLRRALQTANALAAERVVIKEVPAAPVTPTPTRASRMILVTSPTGGCGKTFFATNLAAYLAGATGGRVLLVDLDLQFGEVSLALGLRPDRTIADLIIEPNLQEAFTDYTVEHAAGYRVLSAPADPFVAEQVDPRGALSVLEAARTLFDYVVVDTPPSLNEVVLAALDQAQSFVVMATMDVPSLRNLKVYLDTLERLNISMEDVSCVLNKAEPDTGINLDDLLKVYPRGFVGVLPYSKDVSRSLNVGKPVITADPRADISQKFFECGAKLLAPDEIAHPDFGARPAARGVWVPRRRGGRRGAPATPEPAGASSGNAPGREVADDVVVVRLPPEPAPPSAPSEPEPAPRRSWIARLFRRQLATAGGTSGDPRQ
jgi:pilus assembly protein CpaE